MDYPAFGIPWSVFTQFQDRSDTQEAYSFSLYRLISASSCVIKFKQLLYRQLGWVFCYLIVGGVTRYHNYHYQYRGITTTTTWMLLISVPRWKTLNQDNNFQDTYFEINVFKITIEFFVTSVATIMHPDYEARLICRCSRSRKKWQSQRNLEVMTETVSNLTLSWILSLIFAKKVVSFGASC